MAPGVNSLSSEAKWLWLVGGTRWEGDQGVESWGKASGLCCWLWMNLRAGTCSFGCFICPRAIRGGKQGLLVPLVLKQLL